MKPCARCSELQGENWPLPEGDGCQDCWETFCAATFWQAVDLADVVAIADLVVQDTPEETQ